MKTRFDISLDDLERRVAGKDPRPAQDQESLGVVRNELLLDADNQASEQLAQKGPPRIRRPGQSRAIRALLDAALKRKEEAEKTRDLAGQQTFIKLASNYLVNAVYPYCKGQDLVNEQMAYGETFVDLLLKRAGGGLVVLPRGSRRTESGRQAVDLGPDGTPLSTFPPEGASTQDKGPEIPPNSRAPKV